MRFGAAITTGGGGVPVIPGFDLTHNSYSAWVTSLDSTGCTVDDLGTDTGGTNHIYGLSYGDDESKPWLFLLGGIHGQHEWPNGYILAQFMSYLASPPAGFEGYFQRITNAFRVYSIPIANPYGWINNVYENANSVNLNRNFDAFWASYDGSMGSGGDAPFSEIETQIVRDKVLALQPVGFVDFHIEGGASGCQLEVQTGADVSFWSALNSRFIANVRPSEGRYVQFDGLPQSQQWARTVVASNGHKPLTGTFEPGEIQGGQTAGSPVRVEQTRLGLNFAFQFCLSMVSQVSAGWPQGNAVTYSSQPGSVGGVDTQISAAAVNGNYGTNAVFGAGDATGIRRGLISFPVTSPPIGADVQSATLTLYCESEGSTTDYTVELHRALKQWYEGAGNSGETPSAGVDASTWTNRNHNGAVAWGASGGQSGTDYKASATASKSITGVGSFAFDVTADVQAFINGTALNYGWFLINASEATANSRKIFTSSDGATAANRPKLDIVYK